MFSYQSGINATSFITHDGRNSHKVIFFENYIANELTNVGFKLLYWKGHNNSEFEFIIESNGSIIPIDVKKNKGNLNSLENFRYHNKMDVCIKISSNKYGFDKEKNFTIPLYGAFLLIKDLKQAPFNLDYLK